MKEINLDKINTNIEKCELIRKMMMDAMGYTHKTCSNIIQKHNVDFVDTSIKNFRLDDYIQEFSNLSFH